jgi:hypothetical protein
MSIVLLGSTSGSCTLQEQAVAGTTTLTLPTFNGTVGLLVSGTAVASTSGTSIDFTSIPAGVRRITVMLNGVSTNGTSFLRFQLGSGTVTTTGYVGAASAVASTGTGAAATGTGGFDLRIQSSASALTYGSFVFSNITGNTWVCSAVCADTSDSRTMNTSGSIGLSGVLDRVRITTANGTDTFDAGSINILYE